MEDNKVKLVIGKNPAISNESYHGDKEFISSSGLKKILFDERGFHKQYVAGIREENAESKQTNFDFGSYIHSLILEPGKTPDEYCVFRGASRRGIAYSAFKTNSEGKTVILHKEHEEAMKIMRRLRSERDIWEYVQHGEPEVTYCGELDGLKVKVRADYLRADCIVDVKTTAYEIDEKSLQSIILKQELSYDLSAALYMDVINMHLENKIKDFFFLFISKKSHDIMLVRASDELMENGRRKYKAAINKHKNLMETGFFHAAKLDNKITIGLPAWGRFEYDTGNDTPTE